MTLQPSARSGRSATLRGTIAACAPIAFGGSSIWEMRACGRSARTPTTSWVGSWTRYGDVDAVDDLAAGDEVHLDRTPERRRLDVQDVGLPGVGGQVDGHRVTGVGLRAAVHLQLALDGRSVVLQLDLDRGPGAGAGVTLEQESGVHRQRSGGAAPQRERSSADRDDREDGESRSATRRASAGSLKPGRPMRHASSSRCDSGGRAGSGSRRPPQRRRAPPRSCAATAVPAQVRPAARAIGRFRPVPSIRPFRALRYSRELVEDLSAVVAPPYDVIGPEEHRRLLRRDPRNVVRLDLPEEEPGDPEDERYRRAARTLERVAARRNAAPGSAAGPVPLRADLPRARARTGSRRGAGSSRASGSSRSGRRAAFARTSARSPARARTATGSSARRA